MPKFPRPRPGDPILPEHFQVLYDALDEGPTLVPPLYRTNGGAIALGEQAGFWIRITGAPSGAKHPWKEIFPQSGGTWVDGIASGSTSVDPSYELNGSVANLTGKRMRAWRDTTSFEVRFAYSTCS